MVPYFPVGFEILLNITERNAENLRARLQQIMPDAKTGYWAPVKIMGNPYEHGLYNKLIDLGDWKKRVMLKWFGKEPRHKFSIAFDDGFDPTLIDKYRNLMQLLDGMDVIPKEYRIWDGDSAATFKDDKKFLEGLMSVIENNGMGPPAL